MKPKKPGSSILFSSRRFVPPKWQNTALWQMPANEWHKPLKPPGCATPSSAQPVILMTSVICSNPQPRKGWLICTVCRICGSIPPRARFWRGSCPGNYRPSPVECRKGPWRTGGFDPARNSRNGIPGFRPPGQYKNQTTLAVFHFYPGDAPGQLHQLCLVPLFGIYLEQRRHDWRSLRLSQAG